VKLTVIMSRIYVGNLPTDIKESELDDLFHKYGRIKDIDLKTPARPPAFAFVTFDDSRDAEDAVRGRDGYSYDGYRLRCEFAKGERRGREERRRGLGRRTDYGVAVTNLPKGCSWQDLKDFMRKAGDVVYADVDRYGEGVVEFANRDDMDHAIKTLDDTEFKSYNESSYIRVKPNRKRDRSDEDRGRNRFREKSRSPSRSRERNRSPSRSESTARNSRKRDNDREDDIRGENNDDH